MIPDNSNWLTNNILVGGIPRNKKDFENIKNNNINIFINLMTTKEAKRGKKKPSYDYRDHREGITYLNIPITDMRTGTDEFMLKNARKVTQYLKKGNKVYIH